MQGIIRQVQALASLVSRRIAERNEKARQLAERIDLCFDRITIVEEIYRLSRTDPAERRRRAKQWWQLNGKLEEIRGVRRRLFTGCPPVETVIEKLERKLQLPELSTDKTKGRV